MTASALAPHEPLAMPSDRDASGRALGPEELALLAEVVASGTLSGGRFVPMLEERFAALLGVRHAVACSSGSAAVHAAVAALDPEPGDEIITSPITDMGAVAPILFHGAMPVFADVDPRTGNVTAESIEACLTERTRAIVATHLFGNPCEMGPILAVARSCGVPVIEDCAGAYLARWRGRLVGTLGAVGCFSLAQGQHVTAGEGGLVVTNDADLARRVRLFVNKAWGGGDVRPDHYFLALNYRMGELAAAVAVVQLGKLEGVVERRVASAARMAALLDGIPGVWPPWTAPDSLHVYGRYCLRVDGRVIDGGPAAMARLLGEKGIPSEPHHIRRPVFASEVFRERRTFGQSGWPFTLAYPEALDHRPERFPDTLAALEGMLVLPWNEHYTDEHLDYLAGAIREAAERLRL